MLNVLLVTVGLLTLTVAMLSRDIRRLPLSEALLALGVGILLGPIGAGVLDVPPLPAAHSDMHEGSRMLLAISVMAVALRYPFHQVLACWRPVVLLLVVVLPVMALSTATMSWLVLGAGLGTAALLGAALSPTDPVLATNVVTGEPAERDIPLRNRQLISLESGANDGLAFPLVLVAVALAGAAQPGAAIADATWQVLAAVLLGVAVGAAASLTLRIAERHREVSGAPALLFTFVLALAVSGAGGLLGIDDILAVFVAGLAFNAIGSRDERVRNMELDETINRFLVLPLFVVFGAALPWQSWFELGWPGLVLALAVLLLRRLPILLLMARPLRLGWTDALYLGWFGPIGVSALFYLTLAADRIDLDPVVLSAGSLIVAASTVAHGLSTSPGRIAYRRLTAKTPEPRA